MPTQATEPAGPEEFTVFMRAYQDMVFSTAARLSGDDAQAEDIAQDVFLKAYEHFGALRDDPRAGGWLKTVATNLTLNHLQRYRRRWRLFADMRPEGADCDYAPPLDPQSPDTLAADLGQTRQSALIDAAVRRLPEHQRLALTLYHFEDFSYEQIGARLGVSLAKVKTDIRRARTALLPLLISCGVVAVDLSD